jgi:tRNA/rRNA methyltransferase
MGLEQLAHLRIVLVEPAGPINVGAAARIMKNMGLHHLVLVNPQCDPTGTEAWRMAVHGREVLAAAQVVKTLPEALVGCQRAVATTGRIHPQQHGLETPEEALPWLLSTDPQRPLTTALIFGPEDRGLSNEELIHAQRWIRIPASEAYPSLNLAQAVAVCCYLLHRRATGSPGASFTTTDPLDLQTIAASETSPVIDRGDRGDVINNDRTPLDGAAAQSWTHLGDLASLEPPANLDQIEGFHQDLEAILLKIGYLYPHTAASRMAKLRQLLHRAEPNSQELAMLRGILRQVNWAITSAPRSS